MSAEVIPLWEGVEVERTGVPVAKVCKAAIKECEEVAVIGYTKGEGRLYVASTSSAYSAERTLWLMKQAEKFLIGGCKEEDAE